MRDLTLSRSQTVTLGCLAVFVSVAVNYLLGGLLLMLAFGITADITGNPAIAIGYWLSGVIWVVVLAIVSGISRAAR